MQKFATFETYHGGTNQVSEEVTEKIRLVLVAKRRNILSRQYLEASEAEKTLVEWVQLQKSYRMPLDGINDEFKLKIAKTLIDMFGDKILVEMYREVEHLTMIDRCEKMLDEILLDMKQRVVAELKSGQMFGEQALLRDGVRTTSVRCKQDTHLAYLTKAEFLKLHKTIMKSKQDKRIQFLMAIPLFAPLSKHYLQRMTTMFHRREFIRNQYVFHQQLGGGGSSLQELRLAMRAD